MAAGALALSITGLFAFDFSSAQKRWWAIQPVSSPKPPSVKNRAWIKTPIDNFVLAKLESEGIAPSAEANKLTLLKRATEDMLGLPPTQDEIQALLNDTSSDAWEKVVDRLLQSPQYGERWARHWLDLAHYADSEGFKADETRPRMWRYRDYVIKSFNDDKPYDRFVQEQIAGDELYPDDPQATVALGFLRNFPDESNAEDIPLRRQEILNDITDTVGSVFLGVTYGCARCHDHKFDPILHKDYYRMQAFFANTKIEDHALLGTTEEKKTYNEQLARWEDQTKGIRDEIHNLIQPRLQAAFNSGLRRFPDDVKQAIAKPANEKSPMDWQVYWKALPQMEISEAAAAKSLSPANKVKYDALQTALAKYPKPRELNTAQVMIDGSPAAPPVHVLRGGNMDAKAEEVQPGFLSILDASDAKLTPTATSTGRRSALAHWLTDPKNPLPARVMVNRVWQYHFGHGIAPSTSDLGRMGGVPSHPELLDYLTSRFVAQGWSLKKLHREILLSATYRQSPDYRAAAAEVDPSDKLLWRFPRRRLESEAVRDSMLAVSGLLNPQAGGPGVFPKLPAGTGQIRGGWRMNEDAKQAARRSVYIFVRRNNRYPMLQAFDMPSAAESCAYRQPTVTPSQSLELMNDDVVLDWAKALAARARNDAGLSADAQVARTFRFAYGRDPSESEKASALRFIAKEKLLGADGLAALAHSLLLSNEFLYLE